MSTVQVKLSGAPSLFETKPKLPKEVGTSFSETLKPMEKVVRSDTKRKPIDTTEKYSAIDTSNTKDASSYRCDLNKVANKEEDLIEKGKEDIKESSVPGLDCEGKDEPSCMNQDLLSAMADEKKKNQDAMFALLSGFISDLALKVGASEEEVKTFLSQNGVTLNELLDIDTWKEFTLKLNGLSEASEILTHEKAFQNLADVSELIETIVNSSEMKQITAGLTEGRNDFDQVLQKMEALISQLLDRPKLDGNLPLNGEVHTERLVSNGEEVSIVHPEEKEQSDLLSKNMEGQSGANDFQGGKEANTATKPLNKTENVVLPSGSRIFENLTDAILNLDRSGRLPEGMTGRDVVNQVMDQLKMLKAPDRTTLELMLQPASLGKVLIHVTSKNGVMQAEIRVENPEARQALMNHIADLKVSFENQGFKVEEIEVMLAETGIGQRDEGKHPEEEKKNKSKNRKLDFSVEEAGEVRKENEEEITIGSLSGSSVDYSA